MMSSNSNGMMDGCFCVCVCIWDGFRLFVCGFWNPPCCPPDADDPPELPPLLAITTGCGSGLGCTIGAGAGGCVC